MCQRRGERLGKAVYKGSFHYFWAVYKGSFHYFCGKVCEVTLVITS